ncbi:hypothetical protein CVS27_00760 [Arthrobacter glacialis]|uniref:Uncharacterized protein n=2 Tax=Arthrobacter glacialis TaxID=1664 RepID=A0A2S4A0Z3_ARTGL|nr:hypothetical protein CVS27_00760 [Arthrobacter glacialis]
MSPSRAKTLPTMLNAACSASAIFPYSASRAQAMTNFDPDSEDSETARIAVQQFAAVLSTHDHPLSKTKAGLITAVVTDGMVMQAN